MVCRIRGSVFPRAAYVAFPIACLSVFVHWSLHRAQILPKPVVDMDILWNSYQVILGFLIVFRTNQAYSRYWEGATLLQQVRGEWFNCASSLIAFCSASRDKRVLVEQFQHTLIRLMSMLYCASLQQLATEIPEDKFEIIDNRGMDTESLIFLAERTERCEVLVQWVQRLIVDNMLNGVLFVPAPILSRVFQELSRGIVNLNNARKIADLPFPFPYTQTIIVMLMIQSSVMPFRMALSSESEVWAGIVTFTTLFCFWCMNYIASELEQPFGEDANDLPIVMMLQDMNASLRTLLHPRTQLPPKFAYHRETHSSMVILNCYEVGFSPCRKSSPFRQDFSKTKGSGGRRGSQQSEISLPSMSETLGYHSAALGGMPSNAAMNHAKSLKSQATLESISSSSERQSAASRIHSAASTLGGRSGNLMPRQGSNLSMGSVQCNDSTFPRPLGTAASRPELAFTTGLSNDFTRLHDHGPPSRQGSTTSLGTVMSQLGTSPALSRDNSRKLEDPGHSHLDVLEESAEEMYGSMGSGRPGFRGGDLGTAQAHASPNDDGDLAESSPDASRSEPGVASPGSATSWGERLGGRQQAPMSQAAQSSRAAAAARAVAAAQGPQGARLEPNEHAALAFPSHHVNLKSPMWRPENGQLTLQQLTAGGAQPRTDGDSRSSSKGSGRLPEEHRTGASHEGVVVGTRTPADDFHDLDVTLDLQGGELNEI